MVHTEELWNEDRKDAVDTVVAADQARLYERDGWEVIGYREESGGRMVADIRRRIQPLC